MYNCIFIALGERMCDSIQPIFNSVESPLAGLSFKRFMVQLTVTGGSYFPNGPGALADTAAVTIHVRVGLVREDQLHPIHQRLLLGYLTGALVHFSNPGIALTEVYSN